MKSGNYMMDSDEESTTSRDYDSPRYRSRSPFLDETNDFLERTRTYHRRRQLLEKLPSPREFQAPLPEDLPIAQHLQKKFISISELNPFFDELDTSSGPSSLADDADDAAADSVGLGGCNENFGDSSGGSRRDGSHEPVGRRFRRTSSFRRIWSSLGSSNLPGLPTAVQSKSQETNCSSSGLSDGRGEGDTRGKTSFKKRMVNMSHSVRRQLSATSDFIVDKLSKHSSAKSNSSAETIHGVLPRVSESDIVEYKKPQSTNSESGDIFEVRDETDGSLRSTNTVELNLSEEGGEIKSLCVHDMEPAELIWSIPDWVDGTNLCENGTLSLQYCMEDEKRKIASQHPTEWGDAVEYLRKSVGRDFRRGYLVLGEKMQLPNLQAIRCLKFSQFYNRSFLAIGCEEGTLIILELDYQKPLHQLLTSDESLHDLLYQVPIRSKCRIQMNETLVGHAYDLSCIVWNNANRKLLTSDEAGVIIGWAFGENDCWVEEIINDQSTSRICDMAWSPDGKRVVIGYEDFADNGKITGGVITGLADGTQVYDRKFPGSQINVVVWYSDTEVWAVVDFTLYTFNENGEIGKMGRSIELVGGKTELVEFILKPRSSWISSSNSPEFMIVYKESCMSLYNSFSDKAPIRVHTLLIATCATWSANGIYIAVGGLSSTTGDAYYTPQVHLYNYEGRLLQILKIPEQTIKTIAWAQDSLHLALASERHIYFVNLRPMYKVSSSKNMHCYAYVKEAKDNLNQWIAFWSRDSAFKEMIPGKVIDIKGCKDKFSVLFMDSLGVYHVLIFSETGVKQQHLCIITMEPFALTMTKSSVICLAPNAILNWNYNLFNEENARKFTGALKTTRQVHIDEFPGIIVKPGEKQNHLNKPALDCARCMHAIRDRLCVARESGKFQMYALPTLGFLQTYRLDLHGDICQEIKFNNDGTRLALLTMNGHLRICLLPEARDRRKDASYTGQSIQLLFCDNLTSVSGLLWATDMPYNLCALEGNSLHFLQDDEIIETHSNIPSGCYLTNYEDLNVTMIYMDKVISNPENPSHKMIITVASPSLMKIQESLEHGDSIDEIVGILSCIPYSHPVIRKIVGDEALRQGDFSVAESMYMENKNYQGLQMLETIQNADLELQKAYVHCSLMEHQQAQQYFLQAGRKDLAIKMWKDLGDWDKVNFLSGYNLEESTVEALQHQYDKFKDAQDWEMALEISIKLDNPEQILHCCVMLEDYDKLVTLSTKLPPKDPLLFKIGRIFASHGMIEESASSFLAYGDAETAMAVAVETRHWDLAMKLSRVQNLPLIQPALVKHVKGLIASKQLNPAIQVLDRCGKVITAGKLLIYKGLCLLQCASCDTMEVKQIFVLAAKMLSKNKCRVKKSNLQNTSESLSKAEEGLDLEFLIPKEHLEVMTGHNEWCWSDPWRAAEAIHLLNLAMRFIYKGMMGRAFKTAMYLRKFEDIIGFERLNSLIALTAINNGYLKVASNALVKLENEDDGYAEISYNLFKDQSPKNIDISVIECPGCNETIPDFYPVCPACGMEFIMCIFSACLMPNDMDKWTCKTCCRSVELSKCDRFEYCFLCHSKI